ncbi:hypothetical protein BHE74_00051758 [Ensete ventricosum]|nr:hypothetical protein BHE74_00051758 [Ensete ventricosum]
MPRADTNPWIASVRPKFLYKNDGFCSISNIHPLIKKKLLHMQNSVFFKNNPRVPFFNVFMIFIYLHLLSLNHYCHSAEDLLLKIVQNLSHELNASNKHKWDLILVNQLLREVREAKKRGRKERRHKEAQAVLAAAAAAAAASSRNSSLRKDSNDEIISATQEKKLYHFDILVAVGVKVQKRARKSSGRNGKFDTILKEKDTCGICYFNFGACLKADNQQCGAEDLKSLKQIRVRLYYTLNQ